MKKLFTYLACLLLCVSFLLTGCGTDLNVPTGGVLSNGGSVVTVGDYVYFANTYVDYSTLTGNANTESTTQHNSIFRVLTDEYGFTTTNEDGQIENVDEVYSKIAGFDNSNMYILGEYLYFTSPNAHKDNNGDDRFDLTTLYRMRLDGTGLREIFTTSESRGEFFFATGDENFVLIYDNSEVTKIGIGNNISSPKTLVSDVTDVAFPSEFGAIDAFYYTVALSQEDQDAGLTGNKLYRYDMSTNTAMQLTQVSRAITLVGYTNGMLYYKQDDGTSLAPYYSIKNYNSFGSDRIQWTVLGEIDGTDSIANFTPINENNAVYEAESKIFLATKGQGSLANYSVLVDEDATIEFVYGDYVYYTTANGIYRISYRDKTVQTLAEMSNIQQGACDLVYDEDGNAEYIYFYAQLSTNSTDTYYCHRANIHTATLNNPQIRVECIASVLEEDLNGTGSDTTETA